MEARERDGGSGTHSARVGHRDDIDDDRAAIVRPLLRGDPADRVRHPAHSRREFRGRPERHVAWTHTVSTAQRFTLYQLTLVPGDPTSYLVDGTPEKMVPHTVTVPPNDGTTVTRTIFTSRYGPLLNIGWASTSAIAIRGASADNGRSANEWLAMGEANSIAALRAAQNRYQGIPFTDTIATDDTGKAFFADNSVVPNVTDAELERCVDSGGPGDAA
jgi:acyl-homoserine-lactone acylase